MKITKKNAINQNSIRIRIDSKYSYNPNSIRLDLIKSNRIEFNPIDSINTNLIKSNLIRMF